VYKLDKGGSPPGSPTAGYSRDETKEIRFYGLGGADRFTVEGTAAQAVKVRIIGGKGNDTVEDRSSVAVPGRHTLVYDTRWGNTLSGGGETKDRTSFRRT
jgi:hypothetical protein